LTLVWVYLILLPRPTIIDSDQAGGQIYFSANRNIILFPGDCVILRWQVDRIRDIYLNQEPQIGSGENRMCITGDRPSLKVNFQDGSEQTYTLDIMILSMSPLTRGMVGLIILVVSFHRAELRQIMRHPSHLALLLGILVVILCLFFGHLIPLSETVATATWLEASNALTNLITGTTLMALLLVVAAAIFRETSSPNDTAQAVVLSPQCMVWAWGIGLALTISLIAGTIIAVNPLGMYFSSPYTSYQLLLRGFKTDGYDQLSQTPAS